QAATASVEKIFLLAPGTFRRSTMLVNFTDQSLKGVKVVPNRQDKSRETVNSDFPRRRLREPSQFLVGAWESTAATGRGEGPPKGLSGGPSCQCSELRASARGRRRTNQPDCVSERLEGDDGACVLDARDGLHLLIDEMADVGLVLDVEFHQQVEVAGGRIDLGSELGIRELVRHVVGLAELALDLDEEGDHSRLRAALGRKRQSSK